MSFRKLADEVEEQCATRCRERQVAEFVEDDDVGLDKLPGDRSCFALVFFFPQLINQIDGIVEAHALAAMDCRNADRNREMGFAGACAADQDQISARFRQNPLRRVVRSALAAKAFPPNRWRASRDGPASGRI